MSRLSKELAHFISILAEILIMRLLLQDQKCYSILNFSRRRETTRMVLILYSVLKDVKMNYVVKQNVIEITLTSRN